MGIIPYRPRTVSEVLERWEHLMAMHERRLPMEEGWDEKTLVVAMKELHWTMTGSLL